MFFLLHIDKTKYFITIGPFLIHNILIEVHRILVAPYENGFETYLPVMNPGHHPAGNDHSWDQNESEVQEEEGDKQAVIVGIVQNGIIQNQQKENDKHTQQ